MFIRLLTLSLLLCLPTMAQAVIYWDDEMESFTGGANQFDPVPIGEEVVASPVFSGAGALQYNYPDLCHQSGPGQPCGGWTDRFFPNDASASETNEHYGRLYFRISQNFKWSNANGQSKMWGVRSSTGLNKFWFNFYFGLGMIISAENTPDTGHTTNIPINITMPREEWHCIEWHVKRNNPIGTPTGILEVWFDSAQTLNRTDVQWTGSTGNTSVGWDFIRQYRQGGGPLVTGIGDVAHVWFDRVATGSTRIGCLGAAPPPDTTNPPTPTALALTATGPSVSVSWLNSTDNIATANAVVERCTGNACTATSPLVTLSASNGSVGSYMDQAVLANTIYGYKVKNIDTSSNPSAFTSIVYITTAATFRATLATDNFNRSDNTDLGVLWGPGYGTDDALTLKSNRVTSTNVAAQSTETYVPSPSLANDQWAQITLVDTVGSGSVGTLGINHLAGAVNSADQASYTTASITPTANACVLVAVSTRTSAIISGGPNTPTLTGNGLTYVPIVSRTSSSTTGGSSNNKTTLYRAMGSAPTAGAITIDLGGQIQLHSAWDVTEFTGADTSGTSCSGGIVQSNSSNYALTGGGAVSPATVTLGSVPSSASNATYAMVRVAANNVQTVGTGFTQLFQAGETIEGARYLAEYKLNAQTASSTFTNAQWVIAAVEVRASLGNTASASVLLRHADAPTKTGYECRALIPSTTQGVILTAGVRATQSTASTWTWQTGDMLRGEAEGTNIRCYGIRGGIDTLITSFTDATLASGKAGLSSAFIPMDDWVAGYFQSSASQNPSITSLILDATGANVTFGNGRPLPTNVRVSFGTNSGSFSQTVIEPISLFTGGRYNRTWLAGLQYACFVAVDALGNENNTNAEYQCRNLTPYVPLSDQTPAILTNPFPSTILPAGTTSTTIGFTLNKSAPCRFDLNDVPYSVMMIQAEGANLTASTVITGLTNGVSIPYYYRCNFINVLDEEYPNASSGTILVQVATSTADTILPFDVTNVVANPITNSSDVSLVFTQTGDNIAIARYDIYKSTGPCSVYVFAGSTLSSPSIQSNNVPNTFTCFIMKGVDTSLNQSLNFSNVATVTTGNPPDINPPSKMIFQSIVPTNTSVIVNWNAGIDLQGLTTSQIEYCAGALCSNFAVSTPRLDALQIVLGLTPATFYRLRGRHFDQAGNAGPYSDVQEFTTLASATSASAVVGVCNCRNQHDARH